MTDRLAYEIVDDILRQIPLQTIIDYLLQDTTKKDLIENVLDIDIKTVAKNHYGMHTTEDIEEMIEDLNNKERGTAMVSCDD